MLLITRIYIRFWKRRHRSSRFVESRPGHTLSDGPCWLACLECWRSLAAVACCSVPSRPGSSRRAFPPEPQNYHPAANGRTKSSTMVFGLLPGRTGYECGNSRPGNDLIRRFPRSSMRWPACARARASSTALTCLAIRLIGIGGSLRKISWLRAAERARLTRQCSSFRAVAPALVGRGHPRALLRALGCSIITIRRAPNRRRQSRVVEGQKINSWQEAWRGGLRGSYDARSRHRIFAYSCRLHWQRHGEDGPLR
jgi:hypothetical protein